MFSEEQHLLLPCFSKNILNQKIYIKNTLIMRTHIELQSLQISTQKAP